MERPRPGDAGWGDRRGSAPGPCWASRGPGRVPGGRLLRPDGEHRGQDRRLYVQFWSFVRTVIPRSASSMRSAHRLAAAKPPRAPAIRDACSQSPTEPGSIMVRSFVCSSLDASSGVAAGA
jgi:hypothetical protein